MKNRIYKSIRVQLGAFLQICGISRQHRSGFYLLMVAFTALLLLKISIPYWPESKDNRAELETAFAQFEKTLLAEDSAMQAHNTDWITLKYDSLQLFNFDPNIASANVLKRLGFTDKQIHTICNYREKGGLFRTKTDLSRIYGIPKAQFAFLEDYIQLPDETHKGKNLLQTQQFNFDPNTISADSLSLLGLNRGQVNSILKFREHGAFNKADDLAKLYTLSDADKARLLPLVTIASKKTQHVVPYNFDLNQADSLQLATIKGVGASTAHMVVEYRQKLGGFLRVEQLDELTYLRPEVLAALKANVTIQNPQIRRVNINKAPLVEMANHPYIGMRLAKQIVTRRSQTGYFEKIEQLRTEALVTKSHFAQLKDYVTL
jgi:DNA uptake protein ComE-like DNA-binding protein